VPEIIAELFPDQVHLTAHPLSVPIFFHQGEKFFYAAEQKDNGNNCCGGYQGALNGAYGDAHVFLLDVICLVARTMPTTSSDAYAMNNW
jgi:hypothetical protein